MAVTGPTSTSNDVNFSSTPAAAAAEDTTVTADRFLKLLVAQMRNQDPLSPMDNAQVTSQMAQINTVTGIDKLNATVQGLSSQFMQLQAVQGALLVGHDVIVAGNKLSIDETAAIGQGGFELANAADAVKVEVLSPSGAVVQTLNLGAAGAGVHSFDWPSGAATAASGLTFRVSATTGGVATTVTPLMRDRVDAVGTTGTTSTSSSPARAPCRTARSAPSTSTRPAVTSRASRSIAMGFSQGLSGLNASSKSLEVIGNNIANANTVGAKSSRAEFADVYANAIGGTANNVGIGVSVAAVAQQFTQGNDHRDRQPARHRHQRRRLLRGQEPGRRSELHPRRPVQGRPRRLHRQQPGAAAARLPGRRHRNDHSRRRSRLRMPDRRHHAAVTTTIGMEMNLDARLGVTLPAATPIDFADPSTYNNATSQTVYDAKGEGVALASTSRRRGPTPGTSTSPPTARRSRPPAATPRRRRRSPSRPTAERRRRRSERSRSTSRR